MPSPNFVILYVENPLASAEFYAALLEKAAIETSPTFAMFALNADTMLGLWARATVQPQALMSGGGAELAITLENHETVDAICRAWRENGITIVQQPTTMDFGYTFTALDPDGHRLRVFAPPKP